MKERKNECYFNDLQNIVINVQDIDRLYYIILYYIEKDKGDIDNRNDR